jgi:energy-converting hydrogenase A subunit L
MNESIYLIYIISFVLGSIVGLVLSYRKYTAPYVTKNIDFVALVIAIIGWTLAINSQLLTFIPYYISITIGVFFIALVLGMRPGYGRYETIIGFIVSAIVWTIGTVLL